MTEMKRDRRAICARRFTNACMTYCWAKAHSGKKRKRGRAGNDSNRKLPLYQPASTITTPAMSVGIARAIVADAKLSSLKPISRIVSPRKRCELSMKTNAKPTGIAATSLLPPANTSTTHSAIRNEDTTDTISQPASEPGSSSVLMSSMRDCKAI